MIYLDRCTGDEWIDILINSSIDRVEYRLKKPNNTIEKTKIKACKKWYSTLEKSYLP
jgi:hypothetical protein